MARRRAEAAPLPFHLTDPYTLRNVFTTSLPLRGLPERAFTVREFIGELALGEQSESNDFYEIRVGYQHLARSFMWIDEPNLQAQLVPHDANWL